MLRKYKSFRIVVYAVFGFMLAPLVVVIGASVNTAKVLSFPPQGVTLEWYSAILDDSRWLSSTYTSIKLALVVTLVSVLFALAGSVSLNWWHRWRGSGAYGLLMMLPLIVPFTATGVAMVLMFRQWGLLGTFLGFFLAHIVITIPFAFKALSTSVEEFDHGYFEAGILLGASPVVSFRRVVLPLLAPGIGAGAVFAFLISFDEATVSLLLVGPRISTLPVELYGQASESANPVVAAVATLQIIAVLVIVLVTDRLFGLKVFADSH